MNIEKLRNVLERFANFDLIDFFYKEVFKRFVATLAIILFTLEIAAIAKYGSAAVIDTMPYPKLFLKLLSQSINIFTLSIIVTLLILTEYIFRNKKLYKKIERFVVKVGIVILIMYAAMFIIIVGGSTLYRIFS